MCPPDISGCSAQPTLTRFPTTRVTYNVRFAIGVIVPKVVDINSKRAELVAASLEVIANDGLAGATLRRIAAHVGASTGSITHYFDGLILPRFSGHPC